MLKLHLNFFAKFVQSCCSMPKDTGSGYKSPALALSNAINIEDSFTSSLEINLESRNSPVMGMC